MQLHFFADASEKAMGCVAYARVSDEHGQTSIHMITSKSKVAPVRKMTIPRLELWAALMAAELSQFVRTTLNMGTVEAFFWTDSIIAVYWIRRDPEANKPYVANRVAAIRDLSNGAVWRHIEGTQNPADLLTRGFSAQALKTTKLWFKGPPWLACPLDKWPTPAATSLPPNMISAVRAEGKHTQGKVVQRTEDFSDPRVCAAVLARETQCLSIDRDGASETLVERRSELSSLLRCTAYVFSEERKTGRF